MSYGQSYRQPYQPPLPPAKKRRGCVFGCLVTLTVSVFALLALVLVVVFYLKPRLSQEFGNVVAGQLNEQLSKRSMSKSAARPAKFLAISVARS